MVLVEHVENIIYKLRFIGYPDANVQGFANWKSPFKKRWIIMFIIDV